MTQPHDLLVYARLNGYDVIRMVEKEEEQFHVSLAQVYPPPDILERHLFEAEHPALYVSTPFTLVPSTEPMSREQYSALLQQVYPSHGIKDVEVMETRLGRLIFTLTPELKRLCRIHFGALEPRHIATLILSLPSTAVGTTVHAHVQDGHTILTVHKDGEVLLCQYYDIHDEMDLLYYVTAAYRHAGAQAQTTPLTVSGSLMLSGRIYDRLKDYYTVTFWDKGPAAMLSASPAAHRYYPLVMMALDKSSD